MSPEYAGGELSVFANARRWKAYWSRFVRPLLHGSVLEVGAGLGANTRALHGGGTTRWTCLEPDRRLAGALSRAVGAGCHVVAGTLDAIRPTARFDAILYLDVLEHILGDREELRSAAARLQPGGALVVLAPAHGWLFSEFDRAIGHHRRYDRASLRAAAPAGLRESSLRYLDSVGVIASLANRLLLRSPGVSLKQIAFWDGVLVPASVRLDPLLGYALGKSVLGIWTRP